MKGTLMQWTRVLGRALSLGAMAAFVGCGNTGTIGTDGTGTDPDATTDGSETLRVSFDAEGGNFATATDEDGNEYAFRARDGADGETIITEANIQTTDGTTLKASLDSEGRPVNLRLSDNTAADLVYDGDTVDVRLTDADGSVIDAESGVNYELASPRVRARRAENANPAMRENESVDVQALREGLERFEEIIESIFDEELNPDSPLANNPKAQALKQAALKLAELASLFDFDEVERDELGDDVTLDMVPPVVQEIAGKTFILFDAEGFCIELTDVASRLTFDSNGILQTEFDRYLVFPDFAIGGSGEPGITINYSTGTPINLTPGEDMDFTLIVTPVFTATQVDDEGEITIERRFEGALTFDVELFGTTEATAHKLFDAAFINGELSPDGVLEFDLVLVDLEEESPVLQLGRLRYHDQNTVAPESVFTCEVLTGETEDSRLFCPGGVAVGEDFDVEFIFDHQGSSDEVQFDWFISDGFGFVLGDPFGPKTRIRATDEGFLEITLVIHDLRNDADVFEVLACGISVGREGLDEPHPEGLILECPPGLNVGETGYFSVQGPALENIEYPNWFVFGTSDFYISNPFNYEVQIEIYHPGRFEVAFQAFDAFDNETFVTCEVVVGDIGFDECAANGWYGDGICDAFCYQPDPDCGEFFDMCEVNGWYGDGVCDEFCAFPDVDCEGDFDDFCAVDGFYGDGFCDLFCPHPDPDCDRDYGYDICAEEGWYGDGVCDFVCPQPDPDCATFVDVCEDNLWYGDGNCDEFCPFPDPDCEEFDLCAENGWYGDGTCDLFCPLHDSDCGGDECADLELYGNGVCDTFCLNPDPDCDFFDVCLENGWYGDGVCDEFCLEPDPDCEGFDFCAANGWYNDGVCHDCPEPDPDCTFEDICEVNGYYGDGVCDDFCFEPDPDCEFVDICAEGGFYGDGVCDDFCPEPDPDCIP